MNKKVHRVLAVTAMLLGVLVLPARAQERISNAKLETKSAAQGIEREDPSRGIGRRCRLDWIQRADDRRVTPVVRQQLLRRVLARRLGCGWQLETADQLVSRGSRVRLEPPSELLVLARFENGEIVRVRAFTADCDVDAGGAAVVWFTDVKPDESVGWLATLANSSRAANRTDRVAQSAMSAIAFHQVQAADRVLVAMARDDASRRVRDRRSSGSRPVRVVKRFRQLPVRSRTIPTPRSRKRLSLRSARCRRRKACRG